MLYYIINKNNSEKYLSTCRLANHPLSAQRITIETYDSHHYDKIDNADQYVFIVRCHSCKSEWTEVWRKSLWFIRNNSNEVRQFVNHRKSI